MQVDAGVWSQAGQEKGAIPQITFSDMHPSGEQPARLPGDGREEVEGGGQARRVSGVL